MRIRLLVISLFLSITSHAQTVEVYAGNKRAGVDLMWFRNFQNKDAGQSPFLFFSRNRASVDYHQGPSLFGSTNALSYNFKSGLGIVGVGSFVNTGFVPKAGIQFSKKNKQFLFFGWLVADLKKRGGIDLFSLARYQWPIRDNWKGMGQLELFPVFNPQSSNWNLTERFRLGLQYQRFTGGLMLDCSQTGSTNWVTSENIGTFIRYEF